MIKILLLTILMSSCLCEQMLFPPRNNTNVTYVLIYKGNRDFGPYLTDQKGYALYIHEKDQPNLSNCYDDCLKEFLPAYRGKNIRTPLGVDKSILGTIKRKDGSSQLSYNGYALYYYINDKKAFTQLGQGVNKIWFLMSPKGKPITKLPPVSPTRSVTPAMPTNTTIPHTNETRAETRAFESNVNRTLLSGGH